MVVVKNMSPASLVKFMREANASRIECKEVRLMIVGEPAVGKSLLMRSLGTRCVEDSAAIVKRRGSESASGSENGSGNWGSNRKGSESGSGSRKKNALGLRSPWRSARGKEIAGSGEDDRNVEQLLATPGTAIAEVFRGRSGLDGSGTGENLSVNRVIVSSRNRNGGGIMEESDSCMVATDGIDMETREWGGAIFQCWDFAGQEVYRYVEI